MILNIFLHQKLSYTLKLRNNQRRERFGLIFVHDLCIVKIIIIREEQSADVQCRMRPIPIIGISIDYIKLKSYQFDMNFGIQPIYQYQFKTYYISASVIDIIILVQPILKMPKIGRSW